MNQPKKERFKTSVGGQALMEGIMMRGPKQMCCAVRKPDGTIETKLDPTPAHGVWMKIPLVRGAIAMIESMIVGYRYMMYSAQVSMGDDYDPAEEETAFEKWVGEHLGEKAENALLTVAAVLGGLLAIVLFTVLPTFLVGGVNRLLPLGRWGKVVLEAVLKVAIFLSYMVGISKMKEIHRVFEYHGAEHKTIACYEAGDPLTVERLQCLGSDLGMKPSFERVHWIFDDAFVDGDGSVSAGAALSDEFLAKVMNATSSRPLYWPLQEFIYANGELDEPIRWAAQRVRDTMPRFSTGERPLAFTGEAMFPWMFEQESALRPFKPAMDLLMEDTRFGVIYDADQLARNEVPLQSAVYFDDMYVDSGMQLDTLSRVGNSHYWVTNEFEHDGLHGDLVFRHLYDEALNRGDLESLF
jgi:hypothetical protein